MTLGIVSIKLVESAPYSLGGTVNGYEIVVTEGGYEPKPGNGVDDVSESISIWVAGQGWLTTINRLLSRARERKLNGVGSRVYLYAKSQTDADWWMSEVLDGQVSLTASGIEGALANGRAEGRLTLTRRGYFESRLDTQILLSGPHGASTAVNIDNCLDSVANLGNFVQIEEMRIDGDLPVPVRLSITNLSAGTLQRLYTGRVLNHDAGEHDVVETSYYKDFSGSADATCSGSAYQSASLSTNNETDLFSKLIDHSFQRLGGDLYHVMARFRNNTSLGNVKFRLKLLSGTTTIWKGRQFRLANTDILQDLGVINVPPGSANLWNAVTLVITGQRTTAATETIQVDFVNFIGREFCKIECLAGVPVNDSIHYGGWDGELVHYLSGYPVMDLVAYGPRSLTLVPNRPNGIFFLAQTNAPNTAEINRQLTIQARYRPRRSTL